MFPRAVAKKTVQAAPREQPARRGLAWFLPGGHVSQLPRPGHEAIDIGAAFGTPIYAPAGGVVTQIQRLTTKPSFGLNLRILTAGLEQVFAHLSEVDVRPGQTIRAGQMIGRVGASGTYETHLHYEVRRPGADVFNRQWSTTSAVDPIAFLERIGVTGLIRGAATKIRTAAAGSVAGDLRLQKIGAALPYSPRIGGVPSSTRVAGLVATSSASAPSAARKASTSKRGAVEKAKPEEGQLLLSTPLGDVRAPPIHWWNVAGFALGSVMVITALSQIGHGSPVETIARLPEGIPGTAAWIAKQARTPKGRGRVARAVASRGASELPA